MKKKLKHIESHPRWLLWCWYHTMIVIPLWALAVIELIELLRG